MKQRIHIVRLLIYLAPLTALIPVAQVIVDWMEVSRMIESPGVEVPVRGYDWITWQEENGLISASHVFPRSPAARAGIQKGDVFFQLNYQQYFNAEDLMHAIAGVSPGDGYVYSLIREGQALDVYVPATRYPVFLYPLSGTLWQFSVWGFMLGAFFHLLGLFIVGPLAVRSRHARFSLLLIVVSSFWMFGNLLRLLMVEVIGPPATGGGYDHLFQALTLAGLAGLIGFPALLLHKVLADTRFFQQSSSALYYLPIYLPPCVLGLAAILTTTVGSIGPLTQNGLIAPLLFYASCYIGVAASLVLMLYLLKPSQAEEVVGGWNRVGSITTLVLALFAAFAVLGIVPVLGNVSDTMAGWLIVAGQLLSIGPVILVTLATLKHGKFNQVVSRGLTYLTVLGLIFFCFVAGLSIIDPYLERMGASRNVVAGAYVVLLLLIFERLARRMRLYAAGFFATDQQQTRKALANFQEKLHTLVDYDSLARHTAQAIGLAFRTRSASVFLRPSRHDKTWVSSAFHPEPPYLTERALSRIWPYIQNEPHIWSLNAEINESNLPEDVQVLLQERGAALAIPVIGNDGPTGLLIPGPKRSRRAVFNLEDLDLLRSLSSQLALAMERIHLIEREKALARESAEAQLVALRAQINPHFLFNALNTIISFIEERPEEAEEAVEHLAAIFRHILQTGSNAFVSLEEELALVSHYLSIEQARFGPSLRVEQTLEPDIRSYPVPAFAVQTLVENAVKHGLEKQRGGGRLQICCRRIGMESMIEIKIQDSGIGIPALFGAGQSEAANRDFFGIGLRNVSMRLEQLYGRNDLLIIHSTPETGTTVRLLLPEQDDSRPLKYATDMMGSV